MTTAPIRLLLLEDNPGDARLVQAALAEQAPGEFEVTCIERLAQALARIQTESFDAVLCDLGLPDSSGLATAQAIAVQFPALPLVVLTGSRNQDLGREAIRHGVQDYLVKGESDGALIARTLRYAIERKRLENELRAANEALERRVTERTAQLDTTVAKLNESLSRSRALAETAADAIITADQAGTIVGWNPAAERMFGYTRAEALGQALTLVIPERYRGEHWIGVKRVQSGGEQHLMGRQVELHGLTKAGAEFPLELSLSTWETADGKMFAGIIHDISVRKQTEEIIQKEMAFSQATLDSLPGLFYLFDDQGRFLRFNTNLEKVSGYSAAELFRMTPLDLFGETDKGSIAEAIQRVFQTGEATVEADFLSKDQSKTPYFFTGKRFQFEQESCVIGMGIDITARKVTELALARQKDLYAMLSQTNQTIVRTSSAEELFTEVCRIAVEHGRFVLAWIGLLDRDRRLQPVAQCGANAEYADYASRLRISMDESDPWGRGIIGQALRSGRRGFNNELLNESLGHPWQGAARRAGLRALASLPLRRGATVIGAINVYSNEAGFFTEDLLATLDAMAVDISFALDNFEREAARKRADEALRESEGRLRTIFEGASDGILVAEAATGKFVSANSTICRMLGYTLDQIVALSVADIHPQQDLPRVREEFEKLLRHETDINADIPVMRKDGSVFYADIKGAPIRFGGKDCVLGIFRDITEHKQSEARIRRLNRVYAILSGINTLIVRVGDRDELFREACRIAVQDGGFRMAWIGFPDWEAMQVKPLAWHGVDEDYIRAMPLGLDPARTEQYGLSGRAVNERAAMNVEDIAEDKRVLIKQHATKYGFKSLAVLPIQVAEKVAAVLVLYAGEIEFFDEAGMKLLRELAGDIGFALDHIEKAHRLDYLAFYDPLTGLANRTLFADRLNQFAHGAGLAGEQFALVLIDLDRFRRVNESLGRQAGDELLKQFAGRLASGADSGELARISADVFAVVLLVLSGKSEATRRIERLWQDCFSAPFRLGDTEQRVSAKAGVALFPGDAGNAETLFFSAEAALDKAKKSGERHVFHSPELTRNTGAQLRHENQLRQALERNEFVLHYQPKVDFDSRRIAGVEALIRWQSPQLGLVPPLKFIALLEETGLIVEVGAWALSRAIADYTRWTAQGITAPRVAVNVSAIQLRRQDFVATLVEALKRGAKLPGIDLEITESLIMEDIQGNIEKLKTVRDLGVRIAIDDFGTGYSSLGYLARLPVHTLKIDRSFVITMLDDPNAMTLVSTIISLAHSLRLNVVAEGVETEDQAKVLRLLRCDEMQGYLFSRPLPFEPMTALLTQAQKR